MAADFTVLNEDDRNYAVDHVSESYAEQQDKKPEGAEECIAAYVHFGLKFLKIFITAEAASSEQLQAYPSLFSSCYINNIANWPEEALEEFNEKILQSSVEKGIAPIKTKLARLSVDAFIKLRGLKEVHRSAKQSMETSPMLYIRFLRTYLKVLAEEQQQLKSQQDKFDRSIMKLGETETLLAKMKERLVEMEPQIKQKKDELQKLMPGLQLRRREAGEVKKTVERDQAEVEQKRSKIKDLTTEAEESLKEAEPLLIDAANAVSTIKRSQLSEIKSNNNPNRLVLFTL